MYRVGAWVVATGLCASLAVLPSVSQEHSARARKTVSRVMPTYPPLAKRLNIKGSVRMEVLIRPDGTVKSSRVLGGNPVLLQSAADAVRKWRFESATEETAEIVMVTFEPD